MKNLFLALAFVAVACVSAQAGSVSVVGTPQGANTAWAISVEDSGVAEYNSISVEILPLAGAEFLNHNGTGTEGATVLQPGANASFINAALAFPVPFGGKGWSVPTASNGPAGYVFGAGPLGANINEDAPIFLANVVLGPGTAGVANIRLQAAGVDVASYLGIPIGVPEPGTMAMAGLSLIGLAFRRRLG